MSKTPRNGIDRLIPSYYDAPNTEGSPIMRGHDEQLSTTHMFSYLSPEQRVPADHPLRAVRALTDEALQTMSRRFASLYATTGRPSSPPEQLRPGARFAVAGALHGAERAGCSWKSSTTTCCSGGSSPFAEYG